MNQWIEKKIVASAISAMTMATVATTLINIRQTIALPSATVNQTVKKSTVRIDGTGNGSGVIFATNDNGYIVLTNQHVVEDVGQYQITTVDGKSYPAIDVKELQGSDLALVYFNSDRQYNIIARGNSDTLVEGQTLHIAGYPGTQNVASSRTYRFMSESLIGFLAPSDIKDGYELIYSGVAVPGMSGSPIVDELGQLIGVYGLADIDSTTGASYLYGIPLDTALKIATRSGIELNEKQAETNAESSAFDSIDLENLPMQSPDEPNPFGCWEDGKPVDCPPESNNAVTETIKPSPNNEEGELVEMLGACWNGENFVDCPPGFKKTDTETEKPSFFPPDYDFSQPK